MNKNMKNDVREIMSNEDSSPFTDNRIKSLEIFPDFGKFEDCKITIFNNGAVYIDHTEYYPDLKRDVEEIKELVNILEYFISVVKKYYNIQTSKDNDNKSNGGDK